MSKIYLVVNKMQVAVEHNDDDDDNDADDDDDDVDVDVDVPALCCVSVLVVGGSEAVCSETRSGLGSGHRGCSGHDWQHNQSSRGSGHPSVKKTVTTHQHSPPTTEPNVHLKWPT